MDAQLFMAVGWHCYSRTDETDRLLWRTVGAGLPHLPHASSSLGGTRHNGGIWNPAALDFAGLTQSGVSLKKQKHKPENRS